MPISPLKKRNYPQMMRQYSVGIFVLALIIAGYGFTQYTALSSAQTALAQEQDNVYKLQTNKDTLIHQYGDLKKAFNNQFTNLIKALNSVYPADENYTDLARLFDKFFQDNNTSVNPVFVSDLRFGQARIDKSSPYSILPITLTISGTQDNFNKFLKFVENSGVLDDGTRLMDIRSININFTAPAEQDTSLNATPLLNVSVNLNAYFQKSFTATTTN